MGHSPCIRRASSRSSVPDVKSYIAKHDNKSACKPMAFIAPRCGVCQRRRLRAASFSNSRAPRLTPIAGADDVCRCLVYCRIWRATFETNQGLADWLASEQVVNFSNTADWPTVETAEIWRSFVATFTPPDRTKWADWTYSAPIAWETDGSQPAAGDVVRIVPSNENDSSLVLAPDHTSLGTLIHPLNPGRTGLLRAVSDLAR
jgi:hypothetical protein